MSPWLATSTIAPAFIRRSLSEIDSAFFVVSDEDGGDAELPLRRADLFCKPAASTAALTAALSKASTTAGVAPAWRSDSAFAGDRVSPVTLCPAATSSRTRRLPTAPVAPLAVAPAISTRMDLSRPCNFCAAREPRRSRAVPASAAGGRVVEELRCWLEFMRCAAEFRPT